MKRVLITGGGGLLARGCLLPEPFQAHFPTGVEVWPRSRAQLDITSEASIAAGLTSAQAVVNCAAQAKVDLAEREPERTWAVNAVAPGLLARLCADRGIPLVHVSTDYVLHAADGHLVPHQPVQPAGRYAESKAAGERAAAEHGATIVRVQWLYDPVWPCFFSRAMARARAGEALKLVTDQVGCPTPARLAGACLVAAASQLRPGEGGIHHLACRGEATAQAWISAGATHLGIALDATGTTRAALGGAPRPARSCLDPSTFEARFGVVLPRWDHALAAVCQPGMAG